MKFKMVIEDRKVFYIYGLIVNKFNGVVVKKFLKNNKMYMKINRYWINKVIMNKKNKCWNNNIGV